MAKVRKRGALCTQLAQMCHLNPGVQLDICSSDSAFSAGTQSTRIDFQKQAIRPNLDLGWQEDG